MERVLEVLGEGVNLLAVYTYFTNIYGMRQKKRVAFFVCVLYVLLGFFCNIAFQTLPLNLLIYILAGILIFRYLYEIKIVMAIFYNIIYVGIGALSELLAEIVLSLYYKNSYEEIFSDPLQYNLVALIARVLFFIIVRNLIYIKKLKKYRCVNVKNMVFLMSTMFSYMFCVAGISYFMQINTYAGIIVIIIMLISIIIINISTLYLFEEVIEKQILEKRRELYEAELNYQNHYEEFVKSYEDMRNMKHELKNFLIPLRNSAKDNSMVKVFIQSVEEQIQEIMPICHTGNFVMDSVINTKAKELKSDGGELVVKILAERNIEIEAIDLVIILGNLLDNAMRAVKEAEDKTVFLEMRTEGEVMIIKQKNHYKGKITEENGEIKTTKIDIENHGIGIKNIREVVEKYHGNMEILHEKDLFCVNMILYIKKGVK